MTIVNVSIDTVVQALDGLADGDQPTAIQIDRAFPYTGQAICSALVVEDDAQWLAFLDELRKVDSETCELLRRADAHWALGSRLVHYFPGVIFRGALCAYDEAGDD